MRPAESGRIYLDYNATAPLHPAARERMLAALDGADGNPSSPHAFGQQARNLLEEARAGLAGLLGFRRREVLFTSGGSEGNNLLLRWPAALKGPRHVILTPIEHPSALQCALWLEGQGVAVDTLPVDARGVVDLEPLEDMLRPETVLISMMAANNETGAIQPVAELARRVRQAREQGALPPVTIHCDAVQAFGRIPLELAGWGVDAVTVAAHKLGGPKGVGAVAVRENLDIPPLILGGRQERGLRAGTESVFLAQGFLAAAEWAIGHLDPLGTSIGALRERLVGQVRDIAGFFQNGPEDSRLPNTANLGFAGVTAQSLLVALDLRGIAVSTGSACSSGAMEPSHVLTAMGLPSERIEASLRISLGYATTESEVNRCAQVMREEVTRLRAQPRQATA